MSDVVKRAREAFGQGPLKGLVSLWDCVEFVEIPDQRAPGDVQTFSDDPGTVTLMPSIKNREEHIANHIIFKAIGRYAARPTDEKWQRRWDYKFLIPESTQVAQVQDKLASEQFSTFKELVESFNTAVDRLVALNICNALLRSHTNRQGAKNLDLKQWGSTMEYAKLKRYHSLKPLATAYCDSELCENYPVAFAMMATGADLASESSVSRALKRLVKELAEEA